MLDETYIFYKKFSNLINKSYKYILFVSSFFILISSSDKINFKKFFNSRFPLNSINQKNQVCICATGKQENRYIKEYVEHYKNLGVDKIFLYDNNNKKGEKFESVLSKYIKENYIEIFDYRGKVSPQLKLYEKCYNNNKKYYDWFIFFDIDEFIHLSNYTNIKDFLNENKFKKCNLIYFNCVRHTDNDLLYYDNRTLAERFPIIKWNSSMYTLKTIMRGHNKHHIKFRTTHWLNRGLKMGCNVFGKVTFPTGRVKLGKNINHPQHKIYYIDHYCFKSTEEYINKINKGDGVFGYNKRIKMHKINLYFKYNKITLEKINFIENETHLNLSHFKLMINNNNS